MHTLLVAQVCGALYNIYEFARTLQHLILGGYDRDGPQLYMVEPSGVSYRYFGAAIRKGKQAAKTEIEKLKLSEMTCRQGVIGVEKNNLWSTRRGKGQDV